VLGLVAHLALVGCTPPPPVTAEPLEGLWVASRTSAGAVVATGWSQDRDGPIAPVLYGELDGRSLRLVGLGDGPIAIELPERLGLLGEPALRTIVGFAWSVAGRPRASIADADGVTPFGRPAALPLDLALPNDDAAVLECRDFPSYEGDSTCTGWLPRLIGNGADVSSCCFAHDQCFFHCPLADDGTCRGTACISRCNATLADCCVDQGGDSFQCGLFEVVTNAAGGGGRNGCGRDKAIDFCDDRAFDEGCEGDRCVCEQCKALGDYDCTGCTCEDECAGDEPARCRVTGAGHEILRCQEVAFDDDTRCMKWLEQPCGPVEVCEVSGDDALCVPAACPDPQPCLLHGEREPACFVDDGGPFFNECVADADGCLKWRRRYCDGDETPACVMYDDRPLCAGQGQGQERVDGGVPEPLDAP
jgi:hypothetical protein